MDIGILPVPGFALLSYACTVEPLRAANLLSGRALYRVRHLASASASSGARVERDAGGPVDLLLVVAGGDPAAFEDAAAFALLRRAARTGTVLGGVSGGPVVLARAGLMAGYRMTAHWEHAGDLRAMGLEPERALYVIDRDRVTCAGGTAPMDLMHALIARDHGAGFARAVSDWFIHTEVRPPAGAQRGGLAERLGTVSAPVLDAVAAMEDHLSDPLSLPQLAERAGVTPRHLTRLFAAHLGRSPMSHYRELRLRLARRLAEQAPMPLTEVALACGFASSSHLSRAYAARFGTPPSAARRGGRGS